MSKKIGFTLFILCKEVRKIDLRWIVSIYGGNVECVIKKVSKNDSLETSDRTKSSLQNNHKSC